MNYTVPYRFFDFNEALTGETPTDAFNYTPHCLTRDLNSYILSRYNNFTAIEYLLSASNISEFQSILSGVPATFDLGPHGGGHFSLGPQGGDFFASPADPAFYFHHAMIDKLWTEWQATDPESRLFALYGTQTILDVPPSPNVTLNDTLDWNVLGERRSVKDTMQVGSGWLAYQYT